MEWDKFWGLFHNAWGHCHESPEYDKKVFTEMQGMLQNLERECKERPATGFHKM